MSHSNDVGIPKIFKVDSLIKPCCSLRVCLRYVLLQLYSGYGTTILVLVQGPTVATASCGSAGEGQFQVDRSEVVTLMRGSYKPHIAMLSKVSALHGDTHLSTTHLKLSLIKSSIDVTNIPESPIWLNKGIYLK